MSIIEIRSRSELLRAINASDIVIIEYYKPGSSESIKFERVIQSLTRTADPDILFLRVNIDNSELGANIDTVPCLRVYHRGKIVFEQKGSFGKPDLDLYVLRRSIRAVLRDRNVNLKI